jgi:signal transduction histidine kinase
VIDQEKVGILLVDSRSAVLRSCEAILDALGENLITARSANEALGYLSKREIAVIVIGVSAPELDGFQLASMIRADPRLRKTAVIFISTIEVSDLDLLRGYELGGVDFLAGPLAPQLLRAKVTTFAELYRKVAQAEKQNAELERRFAEQTAELAAANAEFDRRVEERAASFARVHEIQKNESLSRVAQGVAHDFNNVLMAVLGNLELARKYLGAEPRVRRLVDGAIRSAERGASLTKRMLAFAGCQELRPENVEVAKLVSGMLETLRRLLAPAIHIATHFEPDLPPIRIDPNQLELALLNLAVNARDAMPLGGRLTIAARYERVSGNGATGLGPGDYVIIAVEDTGDGMDAETLRHATEPFFTTKGQGGSSGLGLSMVDGLVAQSGGAVRISSQPGRGTSVELWLPLAGLHEAEEPRHTTVLPSLDAGCSYRVLVVDDDVMVSAGTAVLLEDLGYSVIEADSPRRALEILREGSRIDIVITDHAMPGMTGIELASEIHRTRPGLPVVIATGYSDPPQATPALPRLNKPYRQQDLAVLIARLLNPPASTPARPQATVIKGLGILSAKA